MSSDAIRIAVTELNQVFEERDRAVTLIHRLMLHWVEKEHEVWEAFTNVPEINVTTYREVLTDMSVFVEALARRHGS